MKKIYCVCVRMPERDHALKLPAIATNQPRTALRSLMTIPTFL